MTDDSLEVQVPPDALRRLCTAVLVSLGTPARIAESVAGHLVDANLTGYDSHGVHLLPVYAQDIRIGELLPKNDPIVVWQRPAAAYVSGEWGFGHHTSQVAMELGCQLARDSGIAIVGMVRLHHTGRVGAYVEQAARKGYASLAFVAGTGGAVQAVPWGGTLPVYGANPFAAGFPVGEDRHLVVDYATTAVAGGKVMLARASGSPLPDGTLLDREGKPSNDPEDLFQGGGLLPFGAHKGYGLALTVELLARVLTGSDAVAGPHVGGERFGRAGSTFVVIDADLFRKGAEKEAGRTFEAIRSVPPVNKDDPVRTPGEREARVRRDRSVHGIPLPRHTLHAIAELAESLEVEPELVEAVGR